MKILEPGAYILAIEDLKEIITRLDYLTDFFDKKELDGFSNTMKEYQTDIIAMRKLLIDFTKEQFGIEK